METTAVIVARKDSQRIPNKALQNIGNNTLIEHKIKQLNECDHVDRIAVGSDCEKILSICKKYNVETYQRLPEFCDEKSKTPNDMIENMCSFFTTDLILWAHCTNPFINSNLYDQAIIQYHIQKQQGYDSLLSVQEIKDHLWDSNKKPFNYDPYNGIHPLSNTLPPLYKQTGGIFIQPHEQMKQNRYFFGKNPYLFITDQIASIDINTQQDLDLARAVLGYNHE